jgi:hypothetical protein
MENQGKALHGQFRIELDGAMGYCGMPSELRVRRQQFLRVETGVYSEMVLPRRSATGPSREQDRPCKEWDNGASSNHPR